MENTHKNGKTFDMKKQKEEKTGFSFYKKNTSNCDGDVIKTFLI